ncbi:MAG: NAD-dependent epimerase/dehydratase family protein [bacterium]|nr:NAD-dependent epimerase/dehydratase family protein [bacterium]
MVVLVIGGTGFLGRQLVPELLRAGHEVLVYHRGQREGLPFPGVRHLHGERGDLGRLTAPVPVEAVIDIRPMNGEDSRPLVEAFRGRVARSVHVSSLDVYRAWAAAREGRATDAVPFPEEAPLREKLHLYPELPGYEKILMERAVMGVDGLPAAVVRLPVIYGPHDRQRREWPLLKRLLEGRPVLMGGGSIWLWQRVYVREAARAIIRVLETPAAMGHIFNAGEASAMTLWQWAEAIGRAAGVAADIRVLPDALLPPHLELYRTWWQHIVGDTTKLRALTGYTEERTREEDLAESVAWHRENAPEEDQAVYREQIALEEAALRACP